MSAPNVEGSKNVDTVTGGVFGATVGASASEPAGFHGTSVVQAAHLANIGDSATGTEIATAVNGILAALIAKGIIAAS